MLLFGDSREKLKELESNSIDAVVTDPPYGLSFMNKKWDYDVPSVELWREVFRVLKPGGHVLSFGGTRTYHRMVVNIEDAGFEIRDQVMWIYGSGFPKSHNLKDDWQGWGTALKPANEPIVLARKPLEKGLTVAENVLKYGTGALNIDGSRIGNGDRRMCGTTDKSGETSIVLGAREETRTTQGRWPANVLFDEAAAEMLDEQSGVSKSGRSGVRTSDGFNANAYGKGMGIKAGQANGEFGDSGGASRFFYVAKASKRERNEGLDGMPEKLSIPQLKTMSDPRMDREQERRPSANHHPTVKPIKLMEYLIKFITPPNGTVLDPFMGSGSTGVAANNLGFKFVGIELNKEYFEISEKRINKSKPQLELEC